jgi:hypothetical protein
MRKFSRIGHQYRPGQTGPDGGGGPGRGRVRPVHRRPGRLLHPRALEKGQQVAATSRPAVEKALAAYTAISEQTAAIMATGTFPLTVTPVALARVADLMQLQHALKPTIDTARLAQEMTSR